MNIIIRLLVVVYKKRIFNLNISKSWPSVVASSGKAHFSISQEDELSVLSLLKSPIVTRRTTFHESVFKIATICEIKVWHII